MTPLQIVVVSMIGISLLTCLLVVREFTAVAKRREELLQQFDTDVRSTKQSRSLLIGIYIALSILSTGGFSIWFISLLS